MIFGDASRGSLSFRGFNKSECRFAMLGSAGLIWSVWGADNATRNASEEQLKMSFSTDPATHLV